MLLAAGESDLLMEAVKQVPALAVLVFMVIWFFKHLKTVRDDHQALLVAQSVRFQEKLAEIIETYEKVSEGSAKALTINTEMIGSIRTLFALVEDDLKNNANKRTSR